MTELATIKTQIQKSIHGNLCIVVGTGSSMSIDTRFGMSSLTEHLQKEMPVTVRSLTQKEQGHWQLVEKQLLDGKDLETALNKIPFESRSLSSIVDLTGDFVASLDKQHSQELFLDPNKLGAGLAIQHFANNLKRKLNVVTTNYDLLLEHSMDGNQIYYHTGSYGNLRKRMDWKRAVGMIDKALQAKEYVNLLKLHGSLNRFEIKGEIIEDQTLLYDRGNFKRSIITPGTSKHQRLMEGDHDPINALGNILRITESFLFLGYGFNDSHWDQQFKTKLQSGTSGIIISRDERPQMTELLQKHKQLWGVFSSKDGWSIIKNQEHEFDWEDEKYSGPAWDIKTFMKEFYGA